MDCLRLDVVAGIGNVLAEQPAVFAALVFDDAYLVVAETITMVFSEIELCIVDQELFDSIVPVCEHQTTGPAVIREIETVVLIAVRFTVEEVNALIAEIAAGVVVNDIKKHCYAVDMAHVDHHF